MNDDIKHVIDASAVGAGVAAFFDALPHIAALFTVIWLGLRIVESLRNLGWIGRKARTRHEDERDDDEPGAA
jgi:hypothetical protein